MAQARSGDWGGLGQRKGSILVALVLLAVIGATTNGVDGETVDVAGLFLPLCVVVILLASRPTLRFVEARQRPWTVVAGLLIIGLAVMGLSVGPGPVRLVAAVLFLLVGLFFVTAALVPAVGSRIPGLFPGVTGDPRP